MQYPIHTHSFLSPLHRTALVAGYVRSVSPDWSTDDQVLSLMRCGVDRSDVWGDNITGAGGGRRGWQGLWRLLQEGDTIMVVSIDALGRNLGEIVENLDAIISNKLRLAVCAGGIAVHHSDMRMMPAILTSLVDYERRSVVERSQRRLEKAGASGAPIGRRAKLTADMLDAAISRTNAGECQAWIAADLGVHRNTLSRAIERRRTALRYVRRAAVSPPEAS